MYSTKSLFGQWLFAKLRVHLNVGTSNCWFQFYRANPPGRKGQKCASSLIRQHLNCLPIFAFNDCSVLRRNNWTMYTWFRGKEKQGKSTCSSCQAVHMPRSAIMHLCDRISINCFIWWKVVSAVEVNWRTDLQYFVVFRRNGFHLNCCYCTQETRGASLQVVRTKKGPLLRVRITFCLQAFRIPSVVHQ